MKVPTRRRTRAREVAMQILFQVDLRGPDYFTELDRTIEQACADESQDEADVARFAAGLVRGTLERREEIDRRLQSVTRNWDLRRMANIDRNVLRMAIYELVFGDDVPPKVAINEAIDLAKKFSTANSGGFVNGILDRVRIDLEAELRQRRNPASPADPTDPASAGPASTGRAPAEQRDMDSGDASA